MCVKDEVESIEQLKNKVKVLHEIVEKQQNQLRCLQCELDNKHTSIAAVCG